jgi:phenylalanyl-tRNA synthetase alpha chain
LSELNEKEVIENSVSLVAKYECAHAQVYAALISMVSDELVVLEGLESRSIQLTEEGSNYANHGTPEAQYVSALVKDEETLKTDLEAKIGAKLAKIGFGKAMKNKWISICGEKKEKVKRIVDEIKDADQVLLSSYVAEKMADKHDKKVVE